MNVQNTIFNSYPRPTTLNLPETASDTSASTSWLTRVLATLDAWSAPQAESHFETRMWDIVSSEPSAMAKLMDLPQNVDCKNGALPASIASKTPPAQGLSVLLERVHQSRQRQGLSVAAL